MRRSQRQKLFKCGKGYSRFFSGRLVSTPRGSCYPFTGHYDVFAAFVFTNFFFPSIDSGETVIITSKDVQIILNREFGDHSPYGRKADMLFKSRTELCNFEVKPEGTSPTDMMTQNRKNIRLNRCILENLRKLGVARPRILFVDFKGTCTRSFSSLYPSRYLVCL
jgi:hypothetical protein